MRLRMLKSAVTPFGTFQAGQIVNIPDDVAKIWLKAGLAMEDKSLDGGKETKTTKGKTRKWRPREA